jgi:murein DD-endopeptidase MepM/ murein hydrolase activator NlpD
MSFKDRKKFRLLTVPSLCIFLFIIFSLEKIHAQKDSTKSVTKEKNLISKQKSSDTTKYKGRTFVRVSKGGSVISMYNEKYEDDMKEFYGEGPWAIPDGGVEARYFTDNSFAPSGANVTDVEYGIRVSPRNGPDNFCADDYEIYITSSETKDAPEDDLVFDEPDSCTDGGSDDDSEDDSDIYLNWRSTDYFDGESANQYWGVRAEDTYDDDVGELNYIGLRIYWQTSDPPLLSVSPGEGSYSFGEVLIGNSKTKDFTVENTGGSTLAVEPSLEGSDTDQFSILNGASLSLESGESYTYNIEYAPNESSTHQVEFEMEHNGENIESPWMSTLSGEGDSGGGPASFVDPVDDPTVTRPYAWYGDVGAGDGDNEYHAGVDLDSSTEDCSSVDCPVKAAVAGEAYTFPNEAENHDMGKVVIIEHPSLGLYTLYAHLSSISVNNGQSVSAGEQIGVMGQTGFADGVHLHFEVKDRGVLGAGRTNDEGPWGYTPAADAPDPSTPNKPGHPNWFGYHDPNLFLNKEVETFQEPVPVKILQTPLNVRDYPSNDSNLSLVMTEIDSRSDDNTPSFVAIRRVGTQWYQIHLSNDPPDNGISEGWSATGWVAGTLNGTEFSETDDSLPKVTVQSESARVYAEPSTSSSTLSFVYGGTSLPNQQQFVPFESVSGWKRIYLSEKSGQNDGWVSQDALPVELVGFDAFAGSEEVRLVWRTASERGNSGFDVQRTSSDVEAWETIGFVESKADGGTTTQTMRYHFTDTDAPYAADSLAYRLRQVDTDGSANYTEPTVVQRAVTAVELLGVYPNPVRTHATVQYSVPSLTDIKISLYDALGRRVRTVAQGKKEGRQKRKVDVSELSSGMYFLRLKAGKQVQHERLTVVK